MTAPAPGSGTIALPNHSPGQGEWPVADLVSPDALTLVRFGLRAATDSRIANTVRVIDLCCKVETPRGPCWHRYTGDGYGEHADGSAYNGTGIGDRAANKATTPFTQSYIPLNGNNGSIGGGVPPINLYFNASVKI